MDNSMPKCFDKLLPKIQSYIKQSSYNPSLNDLNINKRLIKGKNSNLIIEITKANSLKYSLSILSELSASLIIDELKNWTHLTQWLPFISKVTPLSKWNDYSEVIDLFISFPYLSYINYHQSYKFLFFWSFSSEHQCYYILFKPINASSCPLVKYGAVIINVEPGLEINNNNILSSKCIISSFIKFKRINIPLFSYFHHSNLFDWIIHYYGTEFCYSILNFLGIVEMKQYYPQQYITSSSEYSMEDTSLTQYQYIISYFLNDNPLNSLSSNSKSRKMSMDYHSPHLATTKTLNNNNNITNPKVCCSIDKNDLNQLKSFLELKRKTQEQFNSGYYKDRDLIRFIIAYQGNVDIIINILEDFANYRKNNLYYYENTIGESIRNRYANSVYYLMKDLYNRPVIQVDVSSLLLDEEFDYKIFSTFLLVFLDDLFERIDIGVDKIALVVNMYNFSYDSIDSKRMGMVMKDFEELMRILMRFYVERLGEGYLININDSFMLIWKYVMKMIGNIQKKMIICRNIRQDLGDILTNEQINALLS